MKDFLKSIVWSIVVVAVVFVNATSQAQGTGTYLTVIPGPVSPILVPNSNGTYSGTGWFPDSSFPVVWGGPSNPNTDLSWWIPLHEGQTLDTALIDSRLPSGGGWITSGAKYSGDCRGYWIVTAYRPTDYGQSGTAHLLLYNNDNSSLTPGATLDGADSPVYGANPGTVPSTDTKPTLAGPGTPVSVTINSNYIVAFAHVEDYDPTSGNVDNFSRTIYSFDGGLYWTKGPWSGYGQGGAVDNRTTPGTPRLLTLNSTNVTSTNDIITGATGLTTTTVTTPASTDSNFAYTHCMFYNRYLQQWVSFYGDWGSVPSSAEIMASGDLNSFYKGTTLYAGYSIPGGVTENQGSYFTVMGGFPAGKPYNSFGMECGQLAWLYNNDGGLVGQAISFIKVPQVGITWNGSSNSDLDTAGNWALTGTGSFTALTDEQNSLTFGGSGGTVTNNIPTDIRVRGITYSAGAGSYTINGSNHFSMEAFTVNTSPAGIYGITNYSANSQTINSPIDVRTAALYLLTNAGSLTLNGGINLMGSGGMVISGTGNTYLNGNIVDTGYTDFGSGTGEFVEGANIGWVVKQNSGTLYMGGNNTYPGRTTILAGVLHLTGTGSLPNSVVSLQTGSANSLVLSGATALGGLNGADNISIGNYNLTIGNSNSAQPNYPVNYTGTISGSGSLTKVGTSMQSIGASNTYTGGTNLQGGTLRVPPNIGTAFGSGPITFSGGLLNPTGTLVINNAISLSSGVNSINTNGQSVTLNGIISGPGSLVSSGSGTLVLAGTHPNTFTGGITVDNILQISGADALGTGEFQLNGGTLQLAGDVDLGAGAISISGTGSTIDTQDFNLTSEGAVESDTGVVLTKIGSGDLTLSDSGTSFDGDLIVGGGTLIDTQAETSSTFSQGNITLNGSTLAIQPSGTGAAISAFFVPTHGTAFTVNGSAVLSLNPGYNTSLKVNIGDSSNSSALNLGSSSLLISAAGGSSTLGSTESLLVNGFSATGTGQIFAPTVVVAGPINLTTDPDIQGDFVTYNTSTGFSAFTGYTNRTGSFSTTSTGEVTNICGTGTNVSGTGTLNANSTAQALRLTGTSTLNLAGHTLTLVGTGTTGEAGLLLNGGTISGTGAIAFGANHAVVYVGGITGLMPNTITGTGGITFTGAPAIPDIPATATTAYVPAVPFAELKCTGTGFSGGVTVEGASLLCNTSNWGTGIGPITLDGQGTLILDSYVTTIPQAVTVNGGGGTIEVDGDYANLINFTGTLSGSGSLHKTGTGSLEISGTGEPTGALYVDEGNIDYTSSNGMTGSTSNIIVANGASLKLSTYNTTVTHNLIISGTGVTGQASSGALLLQGGGNLTGTVTLAGDTTIATSYTSGFTFNNTISGQNYNLTANSQNSIITLEDNILLGSGGLTLSGTYALIVGVKANAVYTGATSIPTGTLLTLNGTINGTSGVTLAGALNGSGIITTPGTVNVSGSFVPGTISNGMASSEGLLTINGNLTLGGTMETYISGAQGISASGTSATGYGMALVNGSATLGGSLSIYYSSSYTPTASTYNSSGGVINTGDTIWLVLRNGGAGNFSGISVYPAGSSTASWSSSGAVGEGATVTVNGVSGKIHYAGHNGLDLTTGNDVYIQF